MKKKGMTLVEVLVATVVFMLTFAVVLSTYLLAVKGEQKQKVYINFESMCKDINLYSEKYNRDWVNKYYNITTHDNNLDSFILYFDNNYKLCNEEESKYVMDVMYQNTSEYFDTTLYPTGSTTDLEMIVNIKEKTSSKYIIDNLVYGSHGGRYEK